MSRAAGSRLAGPALFAAALCLRAAYLWQVWDSPSVRYPMGDSLAYHEAALGVLAGEWPGEHVFYQDPLYPYFLAGLYRVFGPGSPGVLLAQALLGAATVLLVYRVARRLFGPREALLAGAVAAVYPVFLFYDALLLKVSLSLFLLTLALDLLLWADAGGGARAWLSAGFATGLATLTRGNYLVFLPVLLAWVWLSRPTGAPRRARAAGGVALGLGLAIAPVTLHNFAASGDVVLVTSQAGQNFYIGNHRGNATGIYKAPPFVRAHAHHEEEDFRAEAERRTGRSLSPGELSRYWLREGLAEIRADPAHFARHTLRKLRLLGNDFEVPDNQSFGFFRDHVSPLLRLPLPGFGAVLPLALCGMAFAWRQRSARLLLLLVGVYAATLVVFYDLSRYRVPLVPVLLVFAAHAVFGIASRVRARRWRSLAPAAVFLAVSYPVAYQEIAQDDYSFYRANLGIAHATRAREARARAAALRESGDEVGARAALAREEELARQAESELRKGLDTRLRNARLQRALRDHLAERTAGLEALGELEGAAAAAAALVALDPDDPEAQTRLGALYARLGDDARARAHLTRALLLRPGYPPARQALHRLPPPP